MIRGKYSLLDTVKKVIYPILFVPYIQGFVKLTLTKALQLMQGLAEICQTRHT